MCGLVACGGEEEASAPAQVEKPVAESAAGESLTAEEAAILAEFRAQREGSPGDGDGYRSKAAPGESDHDEVIAAIKGEAAGNIPYDFDRAASAKPSDAVPTIAPAVSAPAGNAPETSPAVQSQTGPSPSAKMPTVFRQHQVTDPGMNGMVVNSVLVPEGWKVEGGMTRGSNQLWYNPFFLDVMYEAPDGRQLHVFPNLSFEFSAQAMQQGAQLFQPINGNLYYPLPETPGQWIMELIRNHPDPDATNVQLVSEEPEPKMTKQLQQRSALMYQTAQQASQTGAQLGMGSAFDTQATVVKLRYTKHGIELEESILVAWQYFVHHRQGQMTGGTWSVSLMVSLRGPVGTDYVNDPELMTIVKSLRINPQWQAEMNKYWQEINRIVTNGQRQRDRDWQAHNAKMKQIREETNDIISSGYKSRTAIRDAGHAKVIDAIHEVTPYTTPAGETVKLPSFYDNVYTDGNDRFILTNDHLYNPGSDTNLTGSWQRIEAQP